MRLTVLYLRDNAAASPSKQPLPLSSVNVSHGYFPGRGVPFSLAFHALLAVGYLFLPPLPALLKPTTPQERVVMLDLHDPDVLMYLPELGGGAPSKDLPAKRPQNAAKESPLPASGGSKGLSYPGPQRIISNPPNPTNEIQTVLQPEIKNPPILIPPIPLPNIVQIAQVSPAGEPKSSDAVERTRDSQPNEPQPEEAKPVVEAVREVAPPVEEEASLIMPTLPPLDIERPLPLQESPMMVRLSPPPPEPIPDSKPKDLLPKEAEKPKTEVKPERMTQPQKFADQSHLAKPTEKSKVEANPEKTEEPKKSAAQESAAPKPDQPKAEVKPEKAEESRKIPEPEPSAKPAGGTADRTLVALTPMPAQLDQKLEIPFGEARGRFAISPEPNADTVETKPGSKVETPAVTPSIGPSTSSLPGNEASGNTTVVTLAPMGTNSGGSKNDSSSGIEANPGTASGSGAAAGVGAGSSIGTGSGSGGGAGPGKGAFSGITIIGGAKPSSGTPTSSASSVRILKSAPKPVQSSYGLTVVSTENSGGGLPPYGVFSNERIYTVFLDMRESQTDAAPKWTLEFAVIQGKTAQEQTGKNAGQNQQGLVLPYPMVKVRPVLPLELVRKYLKRLMIVYAVINVGGTMEQISVKDSPDPLLNESVIGALSQWAFRPASLSGESVAVKVLLGIPLWLPEQTSTR